MANLIRGEILAGNLKANQPLLERNIAEELGVSRTPVREALFVLQGEGLVELVPRKYARVRAITFDEVTQIYSLRRVVEAHSAETAARTAEPPAILNIETALIRQKNLGANCTALEQMEADLAFHAAIAAAPGNNLLQTVSNQILAYTAALRSRAKYNAAQTKRALSQHDAILQAIKARQPDVAGRLMTEHIESSTRYIENKTALEAS
ncbi:MAG: GntR family transcriptional regulator [Bauldia litoralis]